MIFNIAQLAMQTSFLAALAVGGWQVSSGKISIGTLVAFLLYVFFLTSPIMQVIMAGPASVEFDQVHFRYRSELTEAHHGVSFTVPPGGMTAFVGPSGAGKTTVFSLIERFYEPDSGRVIIDGTDVSEWPLGKLRSSIGYVEQDAPVLSGTLRENLL